LKSAADWLQQYKWIRSGLGITAVIKQKADTIIDGIKTVDEMGDDALAEIKMPKI
jgi:hypothetical protein